MTRIIFIVALLSLTFRAFFNWIDFEVKNKIKGSFAVASSVTNVRSMVLTILTTYKF